jgi:hypothetical protein
VTNLVESEGACSLDHRKGSLLFQQGKGDWLPTEGSTCKLWYALLLEHIDSRGDLVQFGDLFLRMNSMLSRGCGEWDHNIEKRLFTQVMGSQTLHFKVEYSLPPKYVLTVIRTRKPYLVEYFNMFYLGSNKQL